MAEGRATDAGGTALAEGTGTTMARKYFGTDGIRGLTNIAPMTAAMAMKVGMARSFSSKPDP